MTVDHKRSTFGCGAVLSACRSYRYRLHRQLSLSAERRVVTFIMLNPSTADETVDDPTIRRCIGFAVGWGATDLNVGNAYAWRATSPVAMFNSGADIVGPENDFHLTELMRESNGGIVVAWGKHCKKERVSRILELATQTGATLTCLKVNKDGSPQHPLYLHGGLMPQPWVP